MVSIEGVDYSANAIPVAALRAAGKQFVCRYLARDWRGVTAQEVQELKAGGIGIISNYEAEADRMLSGFAGGEWDARYAQTILVEVGLPANQPIFFSADWDASPAEQPAIDAYLNGAASVLGADRVGVYAGYWVIKRCVENGTARWFWSTYAWSGGQLHPATHIFQFDIYGESVGDTDVDLDRALTEQFGRAQDFWTQPTTTPAPTTTPPPIPPPPTYPTRRQPIPVAGTVAFKGNHLPFRSVIVAERDRVEAWAIHGTRLRAYPHRGAPAAANAEDAKRGHRYKFRYETVIGGETWYAGAGGSFVLATAFSDTEPVPAGKE